MIYGFLLAPCGLGEGSLYVSRKDYTSSISIGQAFIDQDIMLKVAEFLNRLPGADLFKSSPVF